MKRIFLVLSLVTGFASISHAQKGSVLLYGNAGFSSEKESNDDKTTVLSFYPGVGYQFSKQWTAGISGGYGHEKFKPQTGEESKSNRYQVGGFTRYTYVFNPIFSLYGQGDVYYHGKKVQGLKYNGVGIALTPAVGINVSNNFALNISFGNISYETIKLEMADNATKSFDMDFGNSIRIGFSKNFIVKK